MFDLEGAKIATTVQVHEDKRGPGVAEFGGEMWRAGGERVRLHQHLAAGGEQFGHDGGGAAPLGGEVGEDFRAAVQPAGERPPQSVGGEGEGDAAAQPAQ